MENSIFHASLNDELQESIERKLKELSEQSLSPQEREKAISDVLTEGFDSASESLANSVWRHAVDGLIANKGIEAGFERRLELRWGHALDAYRVVMGTAREMGAEFSQRYGHEAEPGQQAARMEALTRLHARGCLVASEVLGLIRTGHAAGVDARWRTLHELSVIADIIASHPEIAERYLDHAAVQRWMDLNDYQKYATRLGYEPFGKEEVLEIERVKDAAVAKYDNHFVKREGWAAPLFTPPRPPNGFKELEEVADLDHLRPYYNLSSHSVHAGSRAGELNFFDRGGNRFRLVGPSNAGFAEPAHGALISLAQLTITLVLRSRPPEPMGLVMTNALLHLVDEAGDRLANTELAIREQEEQLWAEDEPDAAETSTPET